jgi:hypothetical protein
MRKECQIIDIFTRKKYIPTLGEVQRRPLKKSGTGVSPTELIRFLSAIKVASVTKYAEALQSIETLNEGVEIEVPEWLVMAVGRFKETRTKTN